MMRKRTGGTKSVWAAAYACVIAAMITGCGQPDARQNTAEDDAQEILSTLETEGVETLLEGRFYRIPINVPRIENAYFAMDIPEDLLGNTSCIVELGTGAYFLVEPSDVQYDINDIRETEEYMYGARAFRESLSAFQPKTFPMEKDYQQLYEAGEVSAAPSSSAVLAAFQSLEKTYAESSGYAGEYAYDAYEAEYIITVDEANESDADIGGANDGGVTASISMRCSADIHGADVVDEFEYTMIQDEEHEWYLTEDFVLPMERLTEPRFVFASSMPKDGISVNVSKVVDLNKDGMPEVYIISAGGHDYHIFYYWNGSIQQITGSFWTWTSDLFSTAGGNIIAYAEPHTTGTDGILQYTVYEWGEEGCTLKEELWRMPVEWSDIDG